MLHTFCLACDWFQCACDVLVPERCEGDALVLFPLAGCCVRACPVSASRRCVPSPRPHLAWCIASHRAPSQEMLDTLKPLKKGLAST